MMRARAAAMLLIAASLRAAAAWASDDAAPPEPVGDAGATATEAAGSAAQEADERARAKASLTAINKSLTDPLSEVWSIALAQNNFRITPGIGEDDRWNSRLQFQAAMPIALTASLDLITRPYVELFNSQPHPVPGNPTELDRTTALGDIVLLQLLVPRRDWVGNWLLGVGPTWVFPSGSSKWTSSGKWQVGPAAVFGYLSEKWILAALFQDWESFGGSGPLELSSMSLQPIAAYFLPNGWSIGYSGNMLANQSSGVMDRYTIPVGLQVGKVVLFGSTPVKIALGGQWMPVHPARFGQVWNIQLFLQVLRPKLLRGTLSDPSSLRLRWDP
jgi:hypothetical protein